MARKREKELVDLINSFQETISRETLEKILEYVEYNEFGLALEILSETIYESDIAVNQSQQSEIVALSKHFGVDEVFHKFIGRTPPYLDLRTGKQKQIEFEKLEPSLGNIKRLASNGVLTEAVRMHRRLFGTSLEEAFEQVKKL